MRQILIAGGLALSLAGCAPVGQVLVAVPEIDNALAKLAAGDIPRACGIISVAEGYYANVKAYVPARQQAIAAKAAAAVDVVCRNPPTNVVAAFGTLMRAWTAIQAATTVP